VDGPARCIWPNVQRAVRGERLDPEGDLRAAEGARRLTASRHAVSGVRRPGRGVTPHRRVSPLPRLPGSERRAEPNARGAAAPASEIRQQSAPVGDSHRFEA
jgi:hypothetical protein